MRSKSLKNYCTGNHFLIKLRALRLQLNYKKSFTGIFHRYGPETQKNCISELHTKQFFAAHLVFQNTTQGLLPKPNMKHQFKILRNAVVPVKKKYSLYLIFPLKSIKETIFFYEMNPISVLYHCKIER